MTDTPTGLLLAVRPALVDAVLASWTLRDSVQVLNLTSDDAANEAIAIKVCQLLDSAGTGHEGVGISKEFCA